MCFWWCFWTWNMCFSKIFMHDLWQGVKVAVLHPSIERWCGPYSVVFSPTSSTYKKYLKLGQCLGIDNRRSLDKFGDVTWQTVLYFAERHLFDSKVLPISCDRHYKFDYGCSSYPENEAQIPDFGRFFTILGIFRAASFGTSL